MYKRPPKHVERVRLIALYSLMTSLVVIIVVALAMVVSNYGYNKVTGTFEQRGLVQFASTPSNATVEIDGKALPSRTSTKSSVEPGNHTFAVWREGYETWSMTTHINEGSLVWLNYIRLVPKDRPIDTIRQYDQAVTATTVAPNSSGILMQFKPSDTSFRYVDITRNAPVARTVDLPRTTYTPSNDDEKAAAKRKAPVFAIDQWDDSGRYVMMWLTIGTSKQLIIVDTEDPSKTVNVSREFSLPVESAHFSGRSGNILYVVSNGTLRRLNVSEGTASRSLASNVSQLDVFESNTVTYVSKPDDDTGERVVGVYRDGDKEPTILRTVANKDANVSIVARNYYGTTYTAITEDKMFSLYKGHHDRGMSGLQEVKTYILDNPIDSVEFNASSSHVLLRTQSGFASYNIDRAFLAKAPLDEGVSKELFWLDTMHLGVVVDGVLTMRDIDGTNVHELNTAKGGKLAVLSRNGTYVYSFGKNNDGKITLQRIRMILQ